MADIEGSSLCARSSAHRTQLSEIKPVPLRVCLARFTLSLFQVVERYEGISRGGCGTTGKNTNQGFLGRGEFYGTDEVIWLKEDKRA